MNFLKKTILTLATGALLTTTAAHATSGHPYIGAKLGQINADIDGLNTDKATAYGVYAGYSFDHHFGAEAEYITSGNADWENNDVSTNKGEYSANTMGLYGTYHYHFPNELHNLYVKGKLGVAKVEIEPENMKSFDDTGVAGGISLGYNLSRDAAIELEYAKLPTIDETDNNAKTDTDLITLGAHFHF